MQTNFAEVDETTGEVLRVIVAGVDIVVDHLPARVGATWKQASAEGGYRKNFPGVGYTYDGVRDAFIPPKPFPSWVLNETTCKWGAPVPYPNDGQTYRWDEPTLSWVLVTP